MPSIILPSRFYSQPPGALAAADESISSLLLPAGGSMIECARYQPSSVVPFGAALTEGVGKFGRAIQGSGGGLILNNADAYSVNAYTATFVVNITAFDTWGGVFAVSNADATGRFGLQRNNTTTELRVYHDNTSFTTVSGVTTADFTAGGDLVFTTSFAGTATGSLKMYLNGVLKFSGTHSIVPTASSSPRLVLLGERSASATAGTDGKVYLACLHNRQLDDAEVIALHDNPWQLFKPRRRVLYFDAAAVGQVVETDLAQALTASKAKQFAQAAETDSAQAIASSKTVAVAQATETDSAQAISADTTKVVAVGQAQETDAATAISSRKTLAVGLVTETEFAQAIAHYKAAGVLQVVEADSAHSITAPKYRAVAQVTETDVAIGMTAEGGYVPPFEAHPIRISLDAGYEKLGVRAAYVDGAPGLRMSIYNQTSDLMFAPGSGLVFVPGSDLMFGATASSYPGIKVEVVT